MRTAVPENSTVFPVKTTAENSILKTLAYFDIFHYPLTKYELQQYLDHSLPAITLEETLQQMTAQGTIFLYQEYYSLQNNPLLVHRRREGNQRAEALMPKAFGIGRFLYRFPFVRGIAISGSLSKNYADEKADFDYFIITKANRLWVARTFMHLFKKLTFLTGQQHFYCMNYYIDEKALPLHDKNIFTAIETKTLVPVAGNSIQDFFSANQWTHVYFPVCPTPQQGVPGTRGSLLKKCIESLLNNQVGSWLDQLFFRITTKRWQKKESRSQRNAKGFVMNLVTDKHFARSNPGGFQEKVLALYEEKLHKLQLGKGQLVNWEID
jgi:hypothetical protein